MLTWGSHWQSGKRAYGGYDKCLGCLGVNGEYSEKVQPDWDNFPIWTQSTLEAGRLSCQLSSLPWVINSKIGIFLDLNLEWDLWWNIQDFYYAFDSLVVPQIFLQRFWSKHQK